MKTISAEELKERMDQDSSIHLIMTIGPAAYAKCHIPGSIEFGAFTATGSFFDKAQSIVLYGKPNNCETTQRAYEHLKSEGFQDVRCLAGGLPEWKAAGYELSDACNYDRFLKEFVDHGNL